MSMEKTNVITERPKVMLFPRFLGGEHHRNSGAPCVLRNYFASEITWNRWGTRALSWASSKAFSFFFFMACRSSPDLSDRFGFKKVLIVSYLAYLPSILLLIYTRTYSGII